MVCGMAVYPTPKAAKTGSFLRKNYKMLRKKHAAKRMDMHIANITEEVESLNTARTHILDEHMEAEELIEIINRFLGGLSDRDRDILSRDIG